ncbi:MAG: spermidine/putrescine ABC transporter substrate-binding protein [Bryobacterales bacterium]|nr:spermidine/putrescine ABC transporter substrate-binding protein [Bryobacterales bacterium]
MTRRTVFLMGVAGLAGCYRPGGQRLNVFNWPEYVAPDTIPNFEREFGVRVRYGTYESLEEMLARVMTGNSGWDVAFPANYFIGPMRHLDLLAPLDHRRIPNLKNLDAPYQRPHWDPELQTCVPYMWGATGIVYQASLRPEPVAWADLWEARFRNRLTMLDDPAEVIDAALLKLGYPMNSEDPRQLAAAKREAEAQKPLLRAYVSEIVRDQLVAGELLASQLWRTTAMRAMEAAPDRLRFVYPKEGFPIYADNLVILRESKRQELAHAFINYIMRPAVAAKISETKLEATCNAAARAVSREDIRNHPILYPEEATMARAQWFEPLSGTGQRLRDRIWTEIKSS